MPLLVGCFVVVVVGTLQTTGVTRRGLNLNWPVHGSIILNEYYSSYYGTITSYGTILYIIYGITAHWLTREWP